MKIYIEWTPYCTWFSWQRLDLEPEPGKPRTIRNDNADFIIWIRPFQINICWLPTTIAAVKQRLEHERRNNAYNG